jgi:exo-1,4-beta-D-glucosaminidase
LPEIASVTPTYFLKLTLTDSSGKRLSDNFYWLSTRPVEFDWDKSTYYTTPVTQDADVTMLNTLPRVEITGTSHVVHRTSGETLATVTLRNPSKSLAFMVHVRVRKGPTGDDVLPIFWDDNYVSLLPDEERVLTATFSDRDAGTSPPTVEVEGWNVEPKMLGHAAGVVKH